MSSEELIRVSLSNKESFVREKAFGRKIQNLQSNFKNRHQKPKWNLLGTEDWSSQVRDLAYRLVDGPRKGVQPLEDSDGE